jgi:hypothetical protein
MTDAPPVVMPAKGREPGIWLRLPADEYHSDASLGSSAHKKLRVHPTEFFATWPGNNDVDPDDEKDTPATRFGSAVHRLVLEGRKALEKEFFEEPNGTDVVKTMDDMKQILRPLGLSVSGVKEELAKRVKNAAPSVRLYDEIIDEHRRYGRKLLKPDAWARVLKAGKHISAHPQLARSFQGGKSEVSVFWINEQGVRCRARFDYVRVVQAEIKGKPALIGVAADLKSFSAPRQIPIERAVEANVGENLLQILHYMDGWNAMIAMLREQGPSAVKDGRASDEEWLGLLAKTKTMHLYLVHFKSTGGAFSAATRHLPTGRYEVTRQQLNMNYRRFREYYAAFGHDLWISLDDIRDIDEQDCRPWHL